MRTFKKKALAIGVMLPALAFNVFAEQAIEEVIVTGSYIKGSAEDADLPIDVISRADLEDQGNPSILEMVRNLSITSGNIGETNQFDTRGGQGNEGVTTVNLRGMGSARTLVLINGRRHVATESIGVDVSAMPSIAIGRVEVLKDGAAALYGSDAIAGVMNFITRDKFEGLEIRGSHQNYEGSDGDNSLGMIFGHSGENYHFAIAAEYETRDELPIKSRDWALLPFSVNPQSGISGIGNPGTAYAASGPLFPANLLSGAQPDPNCAALGGVLVGSCRFQFTFFDNLIEETETTKLFGEFNIDVNDRLSFHAEALVSEVDLPSWKTSPAYPPQSLFGPDRYIAPNHPGLVDMIAQNPGFLVAGQGAFVISRMLGVAGRPGGLPEDGKRNTRTKRLAGGFDGEFSNGIGFNLSMSWSERDRRLDGSDMYIERMALAIDGLGGANCNTATGTPGVGGCEYYNPFSNAIQVSAVNGATNPQYNAAVANSDALIDYMTAQTFSRAINELLVFDAIFNGESGMALGGGNIGWAAGLQSRSENYDFSLADIVNRKINPCPFVDPASVTLGNVATLDCGVAGAGRLAFLANGDPTTTRRDIYAAFAEFALPVTSDLDVQVAFRYEDYGSGSGGSSFDPKASFSWAATDLIKFRGSASTTFRGPPGSFLGGTGTSLEYLAPASAFKAVDTQGNPNLGSESATTLNFGVILANDNFYSSIDYWSFDFSDPFQTESAAQLIGAYTANSCPDVAGAPGAGAGTPACVDLLARFTPTGTPAAGIQRIQRNIINGADQKTTGLDFTARYTFDDIAGGELTVGTEGTYVLEYTSADFLSIAGTKLANGGEFVGKLNRGDPTLPKPEVQAQLFARWGTDAHRMNYQMRYVSSYDDVAPSLPSMAVIDSHITHDVHYINNMIDNVTLSLSIVNLADEDPPLASTDLSFDPYTHNAFGRMIKVGFVYTPDFGL